MEIASQQSPHSRTCRSYPKIPTVHWSYLSSICFATLVAEREFIPLCDGGEWSTSGKDLRPLVKRFMQWALSKSCKSTYNRKLNVWWDHYLNLSNKSVTESFGIYNYQTHSITFATINMQKPSRLRNLVKWTVATIERFSNFQYYCT